MRPILLSVLTLVCLATAAAAAENMLPNGDFSRGAEGWQLPGSASILEEDGNRFLRMTGSGSVPAVHVPVPEGAQHVIVSMRIRASGVVVGEQGWQNVRLSVTQLDKDRKQIAWGSSPSISLDTNGWIYATDTGSVDRGAAFISVSPSVFCRADHADFDDISVFFGQPGELPDVPAADAPLDRQLGWGDEAVVERSAKRATINLAGVWRFAPMAGNQPPEQGWGWKQVPGSWRESADILAHGQGPWWAGFIPRRTTAAWYEREVVIPADWKGRQVVLDIERVSTDATIFLDGIRCGAIAWPEGEVDLTAAVRFGERQTLRVQVVATLDRDEVDVLMGHLPGQNTVAKAELASGGLTGQVILAARPRGPRIDHLIVQPSVRRGELAMDLEVVGVSQAGSVAIEATVVDQAGNPAKTFTESIAVQAVPSQTITVAWPWADARHWEVGDPYTYTVTVTARGAGIDDAYAQDFGFRELWIDGRNIMFNGTPFRMRPALWNGSAEHGRRLLARGHTFFELWPGDPMQRGALGFEAAYRVADELGLPTNGITPHMGGGGNNLITPEQVAAYEIASRRLMRRARHHPSVVIWGTSGNMTGGSLDPSYVGRRAAREVDLASSHRHVDTIPRAEAGLAVHHRLDPSRHVFIHHGGSLGDIYTLNNYLTGIPLQDREEWLSRWAVDGDMPMFYVEFGTPHMTDFLRGRNGYGPATTTEPLVSEYMAIYQGPTAYARETAAYRETIRNAFIADQRYTGFHDSQPIISLPSFMALQHEFITNTRRSWRTMGITGGMIPWSGGYFGSDEAPSPAGEAMLANNGPTLAWICGPEDGDDIAAFTAKDHSFPTASRLTKRVALLNDARTGLPYQLRWTATLGTTAIGSGEATGDLPVGSTTFTPIAIDLPATVTGDKVDGEIVLEATIGKVVHRDRFAFRVFAPLPTPSAEVLLHDPEGRTRTLLEGLGYRTRPWTGGAAQDTLVVIGREALAAGDLPGDLAALVAAGGRAVIMAQPPHHVREGRGLRMSYRVSRRAFPVDPAHPVLAGLDAQDLRDWSGHGTLLTAKPDYVNGSGPDVALSPARQPYAGWRWSMRGSVSSGAPELPHRSGWRPLLVCEFDLAYSPLMEVDLGRGRLLWCQLDFEDHLADPAAAKLARQMFDYARSAPLAPRLTTTYLGGDAGAELLDAVGAIYQRAQALPTAPGVVVIGPDATIDRATVDAYAAGGGHVLVLPRETADDALGVRRQVVEAHLGSLRVPAWREARGLVPSDLRYRIEHPTWALVGGDDLEVSADGLLGRRVLGPGTVVFTQLDPRRFAADEKTYWRLTRWRQTRALAQVLANLGTAFTQDDRPLSFRLPTPPLEVSLAGTWTAKLTQPLPPAPSPAERHPDPGLSPATAALLRAEVDDADWERFQGPLPMERIGPDWGDVDGEAVFRHVFEVPAELAAKDLVIELGTLDDFDVTYVNGRRVGGLSSADAYSIQRRYRLPKGLIKPGRNVVAIRIWDHFGGGGFTGDERFLKVKPAVDPLPELGMYHPDYRSDWELGDEPSRYYNW